MEPSTSTMEPHLQSVSSKNHAKKRRISTLPVFSPPQQTIHTGSDHEKIHLGNSKFVTISVFNGISYLHLRVFEKDIPSKKGIALCPIRAKSLLEAVYFIDGEAEYAWLTLQASEEREYLYHLGYGTFLKVYYFKDRKYYDIRRYWKPENEIVPTKNGLCLNEIEFKILKDSSQKLSTCLPNLLDIQYCECWFSPGIIQDCKRCFLLKIKMAECPFVTNLKLCLRNVKMDILYTQLAFHIVQHALCVELDFSDSQIAM